MLHSCHRIGLRAKLEENPLFLRGKSMVSGSDFPLNQFNDHGAYFRMFPLYLILTDDCFISLGDFSLINIKGTIRGLINVDQGNRLWEYVYIYIYYPYHKYIIEISPIILIRRGRNISTILSLEQFVNSHDFWEGYFWVRISWQFRLPLYIYIYVYIYICVKNGTIHQSINGWIHRHMHTYT